MIVLFRILQFICIGSAPSMILNPHRGIPADLLWRYMSILIWDMVKLKLASVGTGLATTLCDQRVDYLG